MTLEDYLKAPEVIAYQVTLLDTLIDELRESVGSLQSPKLTHVSVKTSFKPKNPIGYLSKIDFLKRERENLLSLEKEFKRRITLLISRIKSQEIKHVIISRYLYGFSIQRISVLMGIPKEQVEKNVLHFREYARKKEVSHHLNREHLPSNSPKNC